MHGKASSQEFQAGMLSFYIVDEDCQKFVLEMSSDGKIHFIGCLEWQVSDSKHSHMFSRIPLLIQEELLEELFHSHTFESGEAQAYIGPCEFVVSP